MSDLLPVADALSIILKDVATTGNQSVPLADAGGRILGETLTARRTQPPFPASAMDGYAVRAEDIADAPVTLHQIGESAAGHGFSGGIAKGQCVRIFTGAPVPDGADTVSIQENVEAQGSEIRIQQAEPEGRFVRPAGYDFSEGDELLSAGTSMDAAALSLAAAMNHAEIPVRRKPVVAIIASGDELVLPGETPSPDQIIASNSFGVARMVEDAGGRPLDCGIALDTLQSLDRAFDAAEQADIIVTLGGASVGDHDLVQDALEKRGVVMDFWKLAMKPGKPVMFGRHSDPARPERYIGLPGNPVSSLVGALIFITPLIHKMLGLKGEAPVEDAVLAKDLPASGDREEYMRATSNFDGRDRHVTPFEIQDSSLLSQFFQADCLMIRPAGAPPAKSGDKCRIMRL